MSGGEWIEVAQRRDERRRVMVNSGGRREKTSGEGRDKKMEEEKSVGRRQQRFWWTVCAGLGCEWTKGGREGHKVVSRNIKWDNNKVYSSTITDKDKVWPVARWKERGVERDEKESQTLHLKGRTI